MKLFVFIDIFVVGVAFGVAFYFGFLGLMGI